MKKFLKRFWSAFSSILTILTLVGTVVGTILKILAKLLPNFNMRIDKIYQDFGLWILIFLGIALLIVIVISGVLARKKKKLIIKMNKTTVEILFGVLFSEKKCNFDGYNIISCSDIFSCRPGKNVTEKSTHDSFLRKIVGNDVEQYEENVRKCLKNKGQIKNGSLTTYPLGTTITVNCNGKHILVAVVKKSPDLKCIPTELTEFGNVLSCLWNVVRKENAGGNTFNMPLIGSGAANVNLPAQKILQFILLSLYYEDQRNPVATKIRIVIDNSKINDIDLDSIMKDWEANTKKI